MRPFAYFSGEGKVGRGVGLEAPLIGAGPKAPEYLMCRLRLHQPPVAVLLPQDGLLDLAGGVPGDLVKDDPPGPLVPGQLVAEGVDLLLGTRHVLLDLDDGGGDL